MEIEWFNFFVVRQLSRQIFDSTFAKERGTLFSLQPNFGHVVTSSQ